MKSKSLSNLEEFDMLLAKIHPPEEPAEAPEAADTKKAAQQRSKAVGQPKFQDVIRTRSSTSSIYGPLAHRVQEGRQEGRQEHLMRPTRNWPRAQIPRRTDVFCTEGF